jgi:hypothetical protein
MGRSLYMASVYTRTFLLDHSSLDSSKDEREREQNKRSSLV